MSQKFTCSMCGNDFLTNDSDELAIEELHNRFGEDISPEDCDEVCHDCYQKLIQFNMSEDRVLN